MTCFGLESKKSGDSKNLSCVSLDDSISMPYRFV